ncbi:hypothetical protein ACS3SW_09645 [Roseobacteraceae bacterium S113]
MDASLKFDKRVRTIARKNRRIARGHTSYIDATGVIRKKPSGSVLSGVPIKGLLMMVIGFAVFKAIVLASAGKATYESRVDILASGTPFEQAGAWVMQIDPATQFLAALFGPLF